MKIRIRPVEEEQLPLLDDPNFHIVSREIHRVRFEGQERGEGAYLIAWEAPRGSGCTGPEKEGDPEMMGSCPDGARPVGRAYLKWQGSDVEPMASNLEACPEVEDLFVVPDLRSQGIGARILAECERLARERGYPRIGLGVAVVNERARELYSRKGYVESGLGRYVDAGSFTDSNGRRKSWADMCEYLVKAL